MRIGPSVQARIRLGKVLLRLGAYRSTDTCHIRFRQASLGLITSCYLPQKSYYKVAYTTLLLESRYLLYSCP